MPKIKTIKGAKKRFKITGTGKVVRYKAFGSHLMAHKEAKRKRNLRGSVVVDPADQLRFRRMLPNG
ncbi:MAG: 50S ribosomal protein L35 [Chlamydiae bacterium]|nr:50S ribosomal protein L35 [Chlamydiota bacterium]MBI3266071.1 50S ribosomal protein L35 [Chlamydiota bacterium]